MSRPDSLREQWAAAYQKEYRGSLVREVLKVVKIRKGARAFKLGTTTCLEFKVNNDALEKWKVRMCVRGDQQREKVGFNTSGLYSPVLKAPGARLLTAIAAEHGCPLLRTRQAFLYEDMGDDKVYLHPLDWWPEPIPVGHVLRVLASLARSKLRGDGKCTFPTEWKEWLSRD
jgi:hypothetical protein